MNKQTKRRAYTRGKADWIERNKTLRQREFICCEQLFNNFNNSWDGMNLRRTYTLSTVTSNRKNWDRQCDSAYGAWEKRRSHTLIILCSIEATIAIFASACVRPWTTMRNKNKSQLSNEYIYFLLSECGGSCSSFFNSLQLFFYEFRSISPRMCKYMTYAIVSFLFGISFLCSFGACLSMTFSIIHIWVFFFLLFFPPLAYDICVRAFVCSQCD